MMISKTTAGDIKHLQTILQETDLFPSEILPEITKPFIDGETNEEMWLTCKNDNKTVGFCYAVQEQLAEGTWNMLAIAVHPKRQNKGFGTAMVKRLEEVLKQDGLRVLIADTSGTEAFEKTRNFYKQNGYTQAATIPDFWAEGDDKITFWKSLK